MSRPQWSSPSAALAYVVEQLKSTHSGKTENQMNTKHDPMLVGRALETLVSRGAVDIFIDESKVGPERKVYKLKG